jgi:hypothetical protein
MMEECFVCKKEIDRSKPYLSLALSKEKMVNGEIEIEEVKELKIFCSQECYEKDKIS